MYRSSFVEQVQGHQCISTRPLPPLSKNFRNLPLVGHANRPHMRRGHGGAYLSYGKVRQTYRGAPCRISGSGDRRKGARGRIPRGHSCAFCVSSLYLTSPKTIEMTDWAPVWEMYMEFSIYRLDYISSVYIHTHVGLVSAVPGALVTTRPCEDRAYDMTKTGKNRVPNNVNLGSGCVRSVSHWLGGGTILLQFSPILQNAFFDSIVV